MTFADQLFEHFLGPDRDQPTSVAVAGGRKWLDRALETVNARHRLEPTQLHALTMAMQLVRDMVATGQMDPRLYHHSRTLMRLPLFFPIEWAHTWRAETHKKPLYILGKEATEDYLAALKDDLAHVGSPQDQPQRVFDRWLEKQDKQTLTPLIQHSVALFQGLLTQKALHADEDPIAINSRLVAQRLGLSERMAQTFEKSAALMQLCESHSDVMAAVFQDYSGEALWETLAAMLEVRVNDLHALFEADSPLVLAGVFRSGDISLDTVFKGQDFVRSFVNQATYWPLFSHYRDALDLGEAYLTRSPEEAFPLDLKEFDHLAEMKDALIQAIGSSTPHRVLLWGPPGTGKSSLCQALARHTDRLCVQGKTPKRFSKDADLGSERLHYMSMARHMAPLVSDRAVMMVDECEQLICEKNKKAEINRYLDTLVIPEIWIANDLNDVHEAFLRRFDLIIHVGRMPSEQRLQLARSLFKDDNLAARVAQACHTPAALRQAHRWWSLSPKQGWSAIASQLAQTQKAKQAAHEKIGQAHWAPTVVTPTSHGQGTEQVIGYAATKQRAKALTRILAEPERFRALRAQVPRGLLLVGPPGTGKTHLAQCLSNELSVPMVMAASADLALAPERIGEVFAEARRLAPCLVFLDEIDVLGQNPISPQGVVDTKKQIVLNRLLVELNGFDALDGVFVIGATHRPKLMDEALLRAGRLGEPLHLGLPVAEERKALWQHCLARHPHAISNLDRLAQASGGMTPADIAQVVNQAALEAALADASEVSPAILDRVLDEAYWGQPSGQSALNEQERWRTALHEAGHILMTWKNGLDVQRATVRPRPQFLGAVQVYREEGWTGYMGHADISAEVQINLGGMLAEQLMFQGAHGIGVSMDLAATHTVLRSSFTQWGLGQTLPHMAKPAHEPMSDDLLHRLEREEHEWIVAHFEDGQHWLAEQQQTLEALAKTLLVERDMSQGDLANWKDAHFHQDAKPFSMISMLRPTEGRGSSMTLHQDTPPLG